MKHLGFLLVLSQALGGWAFAMSDATGALIQPGRAPQRVVTLAPSLAELAAVFLENDLHRLIGVSERTDYPPGLKKIPSIGSFSAFNLEKVVALKPDLVLATTDGNPKERVLRLRAEGLNVVVVQTQSLEEIAQAIEQVGFALGSPELAHTQASRFRERLQEFQNRAKSRHSTQRVLLQVGTDPLVVAGRGSFLHEAITLMGAQNAYSDLSQRYPRPSLEDAIHRNPTDIVVLSMKTDGSDAETGAQTWRRYPSLEAVKNHRVIILPGDLLLRPSFRFLEGLALLEKALFRAEHASK